MGARGGGDSWGDGLRQGGKWFRVSGLGFRV